MGRVRKGGRENFLGKNNGTGDMKEGHPPPPLKYTIDYPRNESILLS